MPLFIPFCKLENLCMSVAYVVEWKWLVDLLSTTLIHWIIKTGVPRFGQTNVIFLRGGGGISLMFGVEKLGGGKNNFQMLFPLPLLFFTWLHHMYMFQNWPSWYEGLLGNQQRHQTAEAWNLWKLGRDRDDKFVAKRGLPL